MLFLSGNTYECLEANLCSSGLDITEKVHFLTYMSHLSAVVWHLASPTLSQPGLSSTICINENVLASDSAGNRSYLVKAEPGEFDFPSSWPVFLLPAYVLG